MRMIGVVMGYVVCPMMSGKAPIHIFECDECPHYCGDDTDQDGRQYIRCNYVTSD